MATFGKIILLISLVLWIILIQNSANGSESEPKPNENIELVKTTDRNYANKIFKKFGIEKKYRVCSSIDKKTSHVYGYGICKQILQKLYTNYNLNEFSIIRCRYIEVERYSVYPDRSRMNYHRREPHHYSSNEWGLLMVECPKGLFVVHAKDDFYYVFTGWYTGHGHYVRLERPSIVAVVDAEIKIDDFPSIVVVETEDRETADNIFGYNGVGIYNTPEVEGHVCQNNTKKSGTIFGNDICPIVLKKYGLKTAKDVPVSCVLQKLRRYITLEICINCPEESEALHGAKCTYLEKEKKGKKVVKNEILVFNAPKKGYYYVAKENPEGKNWLDETFHRKCWNVFSIISIPELST